MKMTSLVRVLAVFAFGTLLFIAPAQTTTRGPAEQGPPTAQVEEDAHLQHEAVEAMSAGHHQHGDPHMKLTAARPPTDADRRRADAIVAELRHSLEQYQDHNAALREGYQPFLPNLPLPEYHFTNYRYGLFEAFTFNPARPTSLLYKKTAGGYQLVGAMYTAPRWVSEDALDARVPLSVATWHAHVNICMPPRGEEKSDWGRFGFRGAIATAETCEEAGGRFFPQVFGWMLHVYPYEKDPRKVWGHRG